MFHHENSSIPAATLVAGLSMALGLLAALRGHSALTVIASAVVCYTALGLLLNRLG